MNKLIALIINTIRGRKKMKNEENKLMLFKRDDPQRFLVR